uniref:Membrane-anchored lipid-binding protein YSP2-like isoform X2 n=1 Tax=Dermatophagoides pteronyssinus TaxID=6956 RepID=A0A6P6YLX2_DERPT|nr:membrane-anchored lipid-binding protein YSP2-like isoform X2 [Dermatophagoides pteronyssinus]
MSITTQDLNYHRMMNLTTATTTTTAAAATALASSTSNAITSPNQLQSTTVISTVKIDNDQKQIQDRDNYLENNNDNIDDNDCRPSSTSQIMTVLTPDLLPSFSTQSFVNQPQLKQAPKTTLTNTKQIKQPNGSIVVVDNVSQQRKSSIGGINPIVTTVSSINNAPNTYLYDRSNFNHFQINHSSSSSSTEIGQFKNDDDKRQRHKSLSSLENCKNQSKFSSINSRIDHSQSNEQSQVLITNKKPVIISGNKAINEKNPSNRLTMSQKKASSSSLSSAASSSAVTSTSSAIGDGPNSSSMDDDQNQSEKPLNRRQWYHLWLPSYKSRLNQFQRQFSDKIDSREKLIGDFVCAIQRELLLQGRMYVSLNYISFYSNIFGYETIVNISYQDIESISKASTVKLFPNAIQIITNSGLKYFFTSFVSRERAYQLVTKLWQLARRDQPMPWPEIRKLIREAYTTNNLGVDLSDLDDADVEIDVLSKNSKKKKHSKRKRKDANHHHHHHHHHHHSKSLQNSNSSSDGLTTQADDVESPVLMNLIRFLFMVALILFTIQIVIYFRFQTLNQRLLQTQQILIEAMEKQRQIKTMDGNESMIDNHKIIDPSAIVTTTGVSSSYCHLKSHC